jgi:hypothetical protein
MRRSVRPNLLVIDFIVSTIANRIDEILSHHSKPDQHIIDALARLELELNDLAAEIEVARSLLTTTPASYTPRAFENKQMTGRV